MAEALLHRLTENQCSDPPTLKKQMRHIIFENSDSYPVALLIKASAFNKGEIQRNYIDPLAHDGVLSKSIIAFTLAYNDLNKAPVKFIKEYLEQLLPELVTLGVQYIYTADSNYFKVLAGQTKADPHFGYALPCKIKGYEHITVVLGLNTGALIYNPELQAKLDMSLVTLAASIKGTYQPLGQGIIHSAQYPKGVQEIAEALKSLHQYPSLTSDIEGFSLRFNDAGIGTVAFAWDKHNGIAFACDYIPTLPEETPMCFGVQGKNTDVRDLLKNFFTSYKGKITWHHSPYDLKAIIYALWMKDGLDTEGLLRGLDVMTRHFGDTKIIAYLTTNSTAGNVLGLKSLAHEFAGNWAKDEIKDIRKIPLPELLKYNLVDALSTHYVLEKYYPLMMVDKQEELYHTLMLPSLKLIIQMELTGMPLIPEKVKQARAKLEAIRDGHLEVILNSGVIQVMNLLMQNDAMVSANAKLKVKQHPLEKFSGVMFNPNSGPQLQTLLYEQMGLPVLDYTDTKQPATGADTLDKLINHTKEPAYKALLAALIGYGKATKVLNTFIPAFEAALDKGDGIWWLHGSFNLGGTVSGRLSSSDPNLQNIPANSIYGKLIKECFAGPVGWLFCGADFNSLEDMISALTTKDPNKLKVYEGVAIYELNIDGIIHHIRDDATVVYDGNTYTGKQFYETHR